MSTEGMLPALALAASLVNVILPGWLGLTVLLTTERRRWGVWLIGFGLLGTAVFFLWHAALFGGGLPGANPALLARYPLAWAVGFTLPLVWYVVMLWHTGYWEHLPQFNRRPWHRWFLLAQVLIWGVLTGEYIRTPTPLLKPYDPAVILSGPMVYDLPVLAMVYVGFIILCCVLAFDALRHPAPPGRVLGDEARQRARPWLVWATLGLLAMSLVVGGGILAFAPYFPVDYAGYAPAMTALDLLVTLLVTTVFLCVGQAVVAYEVFTGATLPRHGLRRWWRRVVLLAGIFGLVMGANALFTPHPVTGVLLAAVTVTGAMALLHWRAHLEQERLLARLRAVVGQAGDEAAHPFHALCAEVLGAGAAALRPAGTYAALVQPLTYPAGATLPDDAPGALCIPLATPRGDAGTLVLGAKVDGSLYTREEMEVARAATERLLETLATAEMAERLMTVQRARITESLVVDGRTRRALHDDVLPLIHAGMLALSAGPDGIADAMEQLAAAHRQLSAVLREMPAPAAAPALEAGLLPALRALVEGECARAFDTVQWEVSPEAEAAILAPLTVEVLYAAAREAIRNAAKYARDPDRPLTLMLTATADPFILTIADDGIGSAATLSTGASQGILLHSTMLAVVGGSWQMESTPSGGTRVRLVGHARHHVPPCLVQESNQ